MQAQISISMVTAGLLCVSSVKGSDVASALAEHRAFETEVAARQGSSSSAEWRARCEIWSRRLYPTALGCADAQCRPVFNSALVVAFALEDNERIIQLASHAASFEPTWHSRITLIGMVAEAHRKLGIERDDRIALGQAVAVIDTELSHIWTELAKPSAKLPAGDADRIAKLLWLQARAWTDLNQHARAASTYQLAAQQIERWGRAGATGAMTADAPLTAAAVSLARSEDFVGAMNLVSSIDAMAKKGRSSSACAMEVYDTLQSGEYVGAKECARRFAEQWLTDRPWTHESAGLANSVAHAAASDDRLIVKSSNLERVNRVLASLPHLIAQEDAHRATGGTSEWQRHPTRYGLMSMRMMLADQIGSTAAASTAASSLITEFGRDFPLANKARKLAPQP